MGLKRKSTQGIVVGLEYDPNRSAFSARIFVSGYQGTQFYNCSHQAKKKETLQDQILHAMAYKMAYKLYLKHAGVQAKRATH